MVRYIKFLDLFKRKKNFLINIKNINIYWKGAIHTLKGVESDDKIFTVTIPFSNKNNNNLSFLKKQEKTPEIIKEINTTKPFRIVSVSPELPIEIPDSESKELGITVEGPDFNYSGVLTLKFKSKVEPKVHVELPDVYIIRGNKRVKANNSKQLYNLMKNQIFEVSVQMYRLLTFNDTVERVSVNKPFGFEGCSPKLPFRIDDKSSYVVTFMIKAPEFNYSGSLEIEV